MSESGIEQGGSASSEVDHPHAYWATIDLYRTFLFEDGPLLEAIVDAGGTLDGAMVTRIARSYSVARTIPAALEDDKGHNFRLLAKKITALANDWPDGTIERAEACRKTAEELALQFTIRPRDARPPSKLHKMGAPHSAVTKLIWFLKPEGWTVYDRYAANAVVAGTGTSGDRQKRFYEAIAEPLAYYAERLREPLAKLHPRLHAERLIDKYLVLKGLKPDEYKRACESNCHFLRSLPPHISQDIKRSANAILPLLPNDAISKKPRTRRKKSRELEATLSEA